MLKLTTSKPGLSMPRRRISKRVKRWREIFNATGDIKAGRAQQDPSPLFECNGIYFIAVFKGYHPLCGSRLARIIGNKLKDKTDKLLAQVTSDFSIGAFIAPEAFIAEPRNMPTRRLHHFDGSNPDDVYGPADVQRRYDTMSRNHHDLSLFINPDNSIMCVPIWRMSGYQVKCSGDPNADCLPHKYYVKSHIPID